MPTTARMALRYPDAGYSAALWTWIQQLAEDVDARLAVSLTTAARDALPAAEKVAGRVIWNSTLGAAQVYTGAAWLTVTTGGPYLPSAGGALTGGLTMTGLALAGPIVGPYTLKRVDLGTGSGAVQLDLSAASEFSRIVNGASSFTVANAPAGTLVSAFDLRLEHSGGPHAIAWPASFKWPAGTPPTFAAGTVNLVSGITFDQGTSWLVAASLAHA